MSKGMVIEKGADGKIHVLTVSEVEEADAGEQAVLTVAGTDEFAGQRHLDAGIRPVRRRGNHVQRRLQGEQRSIRRTSPRARIRQQDGYFTRPRRRRRRPLRKALRPTWPKRAPGGVGLLRRQASVD